MSELYTNENVDRIKMLFGHYVGTECYYEEGKTSVLKEINISPSGEIGDSGEVRPGFQVMFLFEGQKTAMPTAFAILNNAEIVKSHNRLDALQKNDILTRKNMCGNWSSEDGSIKVSLDKDNLTMVKDGSKQTLSSGCEWWGKYLVFREGRIFITYADKEKMELGVLKNPSNLTEGDIWKKTFVRN